jgi:hypothetical protein
MAQARRRSAPPGSIVLIDLGDGYAAVARALQRPLFEFFDLTVPVDRAPQPEELAGARVLFRIDVMDSAVTSGRWKVVGQAALTDDEKSRREWFFKQDPMTGQLSLYAENPVTKEVFQRAAEPAECAALERAAVWSATHVEDRLRDHHAGRANSWVESLRPRQTS